METALTSDALNHLEKAIRIMRRESVENEYVEPPILCFSDDKTAYQEKAWIYGNNLREVLLQVA